MSLLYASWLMVSTAYCHGSITASGTAPRFGQIAAPREYAFGTQLVLDGSGWPEIDGHVFTVTDRGGAIYGNRLDLFMDCASAIQWGRRTVAVSPYVPVSLSLDPQEENE